MKKLTSKLLIPLGIVAMLLLAVAVWPSAESDRTSNNDVATTAQESTVGASGESQVEASAPASALKATADQKANWNNQIQAMDRAANAIDFNSEFSGF